MVTPRAASQPSAVFLQRFKLVGRVEERGRILLVQRVIRAHLLRRALQKVFAVARLAPHLIEQNFSIGRVLDLIRHGAPKRALRLEPFVLIRLRLQFCVQLEHQVLKRAVVAPRAERVGEQRAAGRQMVVKIVQRAREHALAQHLRLVLVQHAEIGPQRVAARVLAEQMAVFAQKRGAEGVHRLDVRAVDAQHLLPQMVVAGVALHALGERLGDFAAQLARRGARVGNDEEIVEIRALALYVGKEPLDEHLCLARACRRGDEQTALAAVHRRLLFVCQLFSHFRAPPLRSPRRCTSRIRRFSSL